MPCTGANDGKCCPSGFTCGVDRICHAPSGAIQTAEVVEPFDISGFEVGDLNNDLIADLLGVSSGTVAARYGATRSPLSTSVVVNAPLATGDFAIGSYTADGQLDVVIPAPVGVFAFETSTGAPTAVAFPASVTSDETHLRGAPNPLVAPTTRGVATMVRLDYETSTNSIQLIATNDTASPLTTPMPCGAVYTANALHGRGLHPLVVPGTCTLANTPCSLPTDCVGAGNTCTPQHLRVPFAVNTDSVCIDTPGATTGSVVVGPLKTMLGATLSTDGETFFADLDHNPATCPDLVISVLTGPQKLEGTAVVPGVFSGALKACSVDPTNAFIATSSNLNIGLSMAPLELASAPRKTAVISGFGLFTIDPMTRAVAQLSPATRAWRYATVFTDPNPGKLDDFVTTGLAEDVEVFQQLPAGSAPDQFRVIRIPTTGTIYQVAAGDFDGDGLVDVAMAVVDLLAGNTGTIAVSFATPPSAYTPPVTVASIAQFQYLIATDIVDPTLPPGLDQSFDLVVAHGGNNPLADHARLTNLYGQGDREMIAPWLTPTLPTYYFGSAMAIGRFGKPAPGTTTPTPGVLAIFGTGTASVTSQAVDLTRTADSFDPVVAGGAFPDCSSSSFCAKFGRYVTWPRSDAAGGDLLFGLRRDSSSVSCSAYYTLGMPGLVSQTCAALGLSATDQASITAVDHVRILAYDDSSATILVAKATYPNMYSAFVWTLTAPGGVPTLVGPPIDLTSEIKMFKGSAVTCFDADSIELGSLTVGGVTYGAAGPELVVACHGVTSSMPTTGMATTSTQLLGRFVATDCTTAYEVLTDFKSDLKRLGLTIRAADFNGDGIADVVYTTGTSVGQGQVHLRLQCDSHDVTCQPAGSQ